MKIRYLIIVFSIILTSSAYSQNKGFGLGIIFGEPTGISAKLWSGNNNSFNFGAAWSFKEDGHLLLQADYVWHNFDLIAVKSGRLPLYFGIGGRIIFDDDPLLGVRVPVGLNYQFETAPVDLFLELVPILDLIPSTNFDFGGGLGARFWFN